MIRARADSVAGTTTRVDSTDTTLSGIAAAWRTGPITVLRRIISDTTPSGIAAAWRTGPIVILRRTPGDTTPRDRSP
ncbi:hypothetical protein [Streptomyces sp. NPDC102476]|uniref:hypothetical protein n=1 Tax=Streptomyces sp. NPDC102476 TaxID=3366181 RepID=UPI0037F5A98C